MLPEAESDFARARNKALFNEIQHLLTPEEAAMISLKAVRKVIKTQSETYIGMKVIPINKIVGSEGRYRDFDNQFFPKRSIIKERWEHVDEAVIKDIVLPPIKVYELGGLYFVRDGNHRVSVAKSKGVEFIDAEVVSLQTEIKLSPARTLNGMMKQIISYEKRNFYFETNFGDITDYWVLDFSTAGQYDVIYNHILTHKYFINQNQTEEIPMEDAILSWFNNVYLPVVTTIQKYKIMKYFRKNTVSDLYVWIITFYDELKKKFGDGLPLEQIVYDIKREKKFSLLSRVRNFIKKYILKKEISNFSHKIDR
ncbi:MAG: transcriptional regulator [Treponema sp.]|nr:MAG: transcriptional regulator [Treponema sp.]